MQATFNALIKKIEIISLASLDKGARLILDFNGNDDELLAKLVRLQKANEEIEVRIG